MMTLDTLAKIVLNNCCSVSNKKLQKLVYYIYAWYYTIYGKEIASIKFEAWEHGPVCRELYMMYKQYSWKPIPEYSGFVLASNEDIIFSKAVLNIYGELSADELEELTHKEEPWKYARIGYSQYAPSDKLISKESMKQFYKKKSRIESQILEFVEHEYF